MDDKITLKNNKNLLDRVINIQQQCMTLYNGDNDEIAEILKSNPNEKSKLTVKVTRVTNSQ